MARNLAVVGESGPATPLEQLAGDYIASCRARGLARASVEQYRFSLTEVFLPWCREQGITEIGELSQRILDRFTSHLLEEGGRRGQLSRNTRHTYIRHVRQLLNWARKEGETESDAKPQLPRLPRRVLDVLSRDEVDQLEAAAQTERDKLIVRLLADTGIRVGELCALRVGDVTRHERGALLKVRGKGSKERLVPLRPELARRLDRFTRHRPRDAVSDRAFLSLRRGPNGDYEARSTSGVGQLLRGLAGRAGLKKRVHPHLLRHSFATEALRRGMNPVQLAQILGHSGLRTIEAVYSHLSVSDAYDAMMRMLAGPRRKSMKQPLARSAPIRRRPADRDIAIAAGALAAALGAACLGAAEPYHWPLYTVVAIGALLLFLGSRREFGAVLTMAGYLVLAAAGFLRVQSEPGEHPWIFTVTAVGATAGLLVCTARSGQKALAVLHSEGRTLKQPGGR